MISFSGFFEALWKNDRWPNPEPFPWQRMLAEKVISKPWPEVIQLPTASGKTACLDIAIYALACQARQAVELRTAPRRIWFVVDRRIVVDEAFERARKMADMLLTASSGVLKTIAEELCFLSGTDRPLAVARLRGGIMRDDKWARIPSQPAVICSTVDQLGSALLFRGYGHSDLIAPIYAGIASHDSLILLDEAHCAVPFMQTLKSIALLRGEKWAEKPLSTPFRFTIMSATPPEEIQEMDLFPEPQERDLALNHPLLRQRLSASKPALLAETRLPKQNKKDGRVSDDELVADGAQRAMDFVATDGKKRVAVMVNRVATAESIYRQLCRDFSSDADIVLLTGRMRPLDRDKFMEKWEPLLHAGSSEMPERPIILVSTQCLEVGADFSFDALVTECASLDSLRQRFGRLDRLGAIGTSPAVILIRPKDAKGKDPDPIYGTALAETWRWLKSFSSGEYIDFGVDALSLPPQDQLKRLLAPTEDAPVLLPVHLDYLCQTSPRPYPEPDISLFLHGKRGSDPEVQVLWRGDLRLPGDEKERSLIEQNWLDVLAMVPPASPEMLTVKFSRLKHWLEDSGTEDETADLEGSVVENQDSDLIVKGKSRIPFCIWRGRTGNSILSFKLNEIQPGDTIILPSSAGMKGLGQPGELNGMGENGTDEKGTDLAELAIQKATGRTVLRLNSRLWNSLMEFSSVKNLIDLAEAEEWESESLGDALQQVLEEKLPIDFSWLQLLIRDLNGDYRVERHPERGLIFFGRKHISNVDQETDQSADLDDLLSVGDEPVLLSDHTEDVKAVAAASATRCLHPQFKQAFEYAAQCHDIGKLDPRFQLLLHSGNIISAENSPPLGKSARLSIVPTQRRQINSNCGLPLGFRHESLSVQIANRMNLCGDDGEVSDLACQLVASHHGYARPFARIVEDSALTKIDLSSFGIAKQFSAENNRGHYLGAGGPSRFWRVTRRYGWWGIAYLEAIFRLADWEASRAPIRRDPKCISVPKAPISKPLVVPPVKQFYLDALDGSNPLAYLAALGTLRLLTSAFPESVFRLGWKPRFAAWRPVLETSTELNDGDLIEALLESGLNIGSMFSSELLLAAEAASPKNKKGEPGWKNKLKFPIPAYRHFCLRAVANSSHANRSVADYAAAWGSEIASDFDKNEALVRRTRFDFTAGQQSFISMIGELSEKLKADGESCLQSALFKGWQYSREAISMRWDPLDEKRQYALQAVNPTNGSKNPSVADPGANFLAVEALPLFPMLPEHLGSQSGFLRKGKARYWQWVIWKTPVELDVVRSLLALRDQITPTLRTGLGITAVFQSAIVQPSGRYRCFTPARSM